MEEYYREIWIKKWIEEILHLLQQIDKDGVRKYFHYIGSNKNLTLEYIDENLAYDIGYDNYACISSNPHLTFEYVMDRLDEKWDWKEISKHPNITFDMVLSTLDNPYCKWDIHSLFKNPNITYEILTTHPYFTENQTVWGWNIHYHNPNATVDELKKHQQMFLGWKNYYNNPNATIDELKKHNRFHDCNTCISRCLFITLDYVFANPDIFWNAYALLENPNIGKNITIENLWKLAETAAEMDAKLDEIFDEERINHSINHNFICLQNYATCLYAMPEKVRELGNEIMFDVYARNSHLQVSDLCDLFNSCNWAVRDTMLCNLLKNDLSYSRDNFISTNVSHILLVSMHDERSKICHETEVEKVLADEWIMSHVMKYV